jgi:hypothetical protein
MSETLLGQVQEAEKAEQIARNAATEARNRAFRELRGRFAEFVKEVRPLAQQLQGNYPELRAENIQGLFKEFWIAR